MPLITSARLAMASMFAKTTRIFAGDIAGELPLASTLTELEEVGVGVVAGVKRESDNSEIGAEVVEAAPVLSDRATECRVFTGNAA